MSNHVSLLEHVTKLHQTSNLTLAANSPSTADNKPPFFCNFQYVKINKQPPVGFIDSLLINLLKAPIYLNVWEAGKEKPQGQSKRQSQPKAGAQNARQ